MANISRIISTLKQVLKKDGKTYKDVGDKLKISESSVKRLFSNGSMSLERIELICELGNMTIFELMNLAESSKKSMTRKTTLEQENSLAADEELFMTFYLLVSRWSVDDVSAYLNLSGNTIEKHLIKLDKLKLIEYHPNNRIKPLIRKSIKWLKGGPIETKYKTKIINEFLADGFKNPDEVLEFKTWELSPTTLEILKKKLKSLEKEIEEMARLDEGLPKDKIVSTGFLLALRNWTFSTYQNYGNDQSQV